MKPDPLRPIHCVGFFLYAFGHVTDGEISYEEKAEAVCNIWYSDKLSKEMIQKSFI